MAEAPGNQTPDTPDVSETDLRGMKVDELRQEAKEKSLSGTSGMRKGELVDAVARAKQDHADGSGAADPKAGKGLDGEPADVGAGPDSGRIRTGPETSKSLKYSQEITSPDEDPEREGRSLATTHHEVIKQWAEARNARPATVEGTEHGDHLGVLRFDFNEDTDKLRHVSWEEWFRTFDERRLNFIYQEQRKDGSQSNFFILESPDREDA
ncbi:Rho termination factor N-terminal domain-containing protein [Arthrobacter sp. MDT2-2]